MNTNLVHNTINFLVILIAGLETFDWSPFFDENVALKIVGVLGLLKIIINLTRDGVTGLAKEQPPVK